MRFRISSTVLLTQWAVYVLDMFTVALGNKSSISNESDPIKFLSIPTAQTYLYKNRFPDLEYWNGSSLKSCAIQANCIRKGKNIHAPNKSNRRQYDSYSREEHMKSTRFVLEDVEHHGMESELHSHESNFRNSLINGYALLNDIQTLMKTISLEANISVSVIAKTVEYHNIVLCKLKKKEPQKKRLNRRVFRDMRDKYVEESEEDHKKKIILIVHGLSPVGFRDVPCLSRKQSFLKLVKIYMQHLDKFHIYLIPMGNPDGITDESLFMWNKNKRVLPACSGVALDRNFDVHWNKSHGVQTCSQHYPGSAPFSEPETRALSDIIHTYSARIVAYIHVHASTYDEKMYKGDAILHPKGYSPDPPEDKYVEIRTAVEESLRNAGFRVYDMTITSLNDWYGDVSGSSVDYVTSVYGIPYGLEFVMQSYRDYRLTKSTSEEMHDNVLNEVWKRVIDVVFENIFKSADLSQENANFK